MKYSDGTTERMIEESFLTAEEVANTRKPLEQASVLPLRVYDNPAYYEREVDLVLRPSWHALCRVDQLEQPYSFVTANIAGEPVVVMRDRQGIIRALSNICRHRGTRLLNEDCGVAKGGVIMCPYHKWSYNVNGTLRAAPFMDTSVGFDKKAVKLPDYKVELWNGFVFVNLDANAEPLGPKIAGLTEKLAPYHLENFIAAPWVTQKFDWNWKISLENFTEGYHHLGVHWNSVGEISPAEDMIYEETNTNYSIFYVSMPRPKDQPPDPMPLGFPLIPTLTEFLIDRNPSIDIFPTFHVILGTSWGLWLRIDSRSVSDHTLHWTWLVPKESRAFPDFEARVKHLGAIMTPIVDEDISIMPKVKATLKSRTFQPGRYCIQERSLQQMHRWLLDRMEAGQGLTKPKARPLSAVG